MANRIFSYFRESREELKKVVWPTRKETQNNTMLVIGISLFVAVFLGLLDLGLNYLLNTFIIR
jgi:preprotein translocase subunit SecE